MRWGDASSDEESVGEKVAAVTLEEEPAPAPAPALEPQDDTAEAEAEAKKLDAFFDNRPLEERFEFPAGPPFKAFVGNVPFSIKENADFGRLMSAALEKHQADVKILSAQVAVRDGRHRGYGWLEVESLEQLKTLMRLNDVEFVVEKRRLHFNTAGNRQSKGNRRQSSQGDRHSSYNNRPRNGDEVDGSKFRGGKYHRSSNAGEKSQGAPAQRPSLKLKPRTVPLSDEPLNTSSSDIFGGAKPRDEAAWEKKRQESVGSSSKPADGEKERRRRSQNSGRGGGRGGRGRESGRRGSHQEKDHNKQDKPPTTQPASNEAKPVVPAPLPVKEEEKPAPKKPVNKFAALMDSDSE